MSIVSDYCKYVNISKERVIELFKDRNNSNNRNEIIQSHLKLVTYIAKSYNTSLIAGLRSGAWSETYEDLVQEGILGLVLSIDKFDPSLNFRFSTFSSFYIKNKIIDYLMKSNSLFSIPSYKRKIFARLSKDMKSGDICLEDNILEVLSLSLLDGDFCYREDFNIYEYLDNKKKISEICSFLINFSIIDKLIIKLRYFHNKSWRDISHVTGLSHECCRRHHNDVILFLKKEYIKMK